MSETAPAWMQPIEGWQVIEASAGTGKTWTITALIVRALLERELTVDRVLVMTFTRAATAELRERVRRRLVGLEAALGGAPSDDDFLRAYLPRIPDADAARRRLRLALAAMDEFPIQTIHGFCQRMQAQFGLAWGQTEAPAITTDVSRFVRRAAFEFFVECSRPGEDGRAWVGELLAMLGLDPLVLLPRLRAALDHPVVDARPDDAGLVDAARRFLRARERAEALWRSERDAFAAALATASKLPAPYRQHRASWLRKIDEYFARGTVRPGGDGVAWERLCDEGLRAHLDAAEMSALHASLPQALGELLRSAESIAGYELRIARAFRDWAPERIAGYKHEAGEQEHDDAVRALHAALEADPELGRGLRGRFPVCFVDEGQDTDSLQWSILERIYPPAADGVALFCVGDPKQSIYRFRGADVHAYLTASLRADAVSRLSHNRRSTAGLVHAVNALFERPRAFAVDPIGFEPARPAPAHTGALVEDGARDPSPFRWLWLARQEGTEPNADMHSGDAGAGGGAGAGVGTAGAADAKGVFDTLAAEACAAEIARLLDASHAGRLHFELGDAPSEAHPVHAGDIAVLVNSNREGALVRAALARRGLRGSERSRDSVLDSVQADELQRLIAAIVEPANAALVRGAWATRLLGADPALLERSLADDALLRQWIEPMLAAQWRWRLDGPLPALRELIARTGVAQRLAARIDGARAWTNLLHLIELLHQAEPPLRSPQAALAWLERAREQGGGETCELRLESDADLVQIVTVHRSKGLEYPIVFVPFAWSGRKLDPDPIMLDHDPARDWAPVLDFDLERAGDVDARARIEILGERVRHLYVALTRARYRCYVGWGRARDAETTALAWLLHGGSAPDRPDDLPDPGAMLAALEEHVARSGDAACVALLDPSMLEATANPRVQADARGEELAARRPVRRLRRAWRLLSYSGIVQGRDAGVDGRDHDQFQPQAAPDREALEPESTGRSAGASTGGSTGRSTGRSTDADARGAADYADAEDIRSRFPRGAEAGQCLHEILEHTDFARPVDPAVCADVLARYGIGRGMAPEVVGWLDAVIDAPLAGSPGLEELSLRQVARNRRVSELGFDLSLPSGGGGSAFWQSLASALPEHARLFGSQPIEQPGLLRGFIDLVFEHDGRFFLVDWKSNWLGDTPAHYGGQQLARTMRDSAYDIQYLLYVTALHRWLRQRVPGYRYDANFGGLWYLFLRGIAPGSPGAGMFFARPDRAVIADIDRALEAGEIPASEAVP